jgi:hypothetical protein
LRLNSHAFQANRFDPLLVTTLTLALPPDSAENRACCCLNSWIVSMVSFIVTRESPCPFIAIPSAV